MAAFKYLSGGGGGGGAFAPPRRAFAPAPRPQSHFLYASLVVLNAFTQLLPSAWGMW